MSTRNAKKDLSPTQKAVKQPRPVFYSGPNKNMDSAFARDVVSLYVTCGLGYSAIRHIVGDKSDRRIENIIRQHMFGRKDLKECEIHCPGSSPIEGWTKSVLEHMVKKYKTSSDPYVAELLATGEWHDDPAYSSKKPTECPKCGAKLDPSWSFCPFCRVDLSQPEGAQKKLF